ncbi:MAG: FAD-dependent thymidylate synthase [Halanaerobiaceae bacterium]
MEIKPKAELVNHSPRPEKNVAVAARLCYSKKGASDIAGEMTRKEIENLVRKVIDLGHTSTLEHTYFYFHIRCSRVTSHQLVRQRIGVSYSQRSQRYVTEDDFAYITPPSIKKNEEAVELYNDKMDDLQEVYNRLLELGVPEEDARFILPTIKTNLMVSYNARSLLHFFRLRCCRRAQWEIRSLANQMLKQVREVAPVIFSRAGPPCITDNYCPEGELSCGRIDNLQEEHKSGDEHES